jgi:hypothetical protein
MNFNFNFKDSPLRSTRQSATSQPRVIGITRSIFRPERSFFAGGPCCVFVVGPVAILELGMAQSQSNVRSWTAVFNFVQATTGEGIHYGAHLSRKKTT